MCHKGTVSGWRYLLVASLAVGIVAGQTAPVQWRRVGYPAMEVGLASPATGPVQSVWYSLDGVRLYARTSAGQVFETADFEKWTLAQAVSEPADAPAPAVDRLPEPGARLALAAAAPGRIYALGTQLYRSDDGGHSWSNLTAFRSQSIIGPGQRSVAVSPGDPDQLAVANDFGVWRSMDGGLSWAGLNLQLPNLPVSRILATPTGTHGTRILVRGLGPTELPPGAEAWQPTADAQSESEDQALRRASQTLGTSITAVAASDQTVYAGAADGRIWISLDAGVTWTASRPGANAPVERIYADPTEPRVALAVLGGSGVHVLRTTNTGGFWDDLTSNLPDVPARGVTAVRSAGAVYVATDKGIFFAFADLENAGPVAVTWTPISGSLPPAAAADVKLDANGDQLYAALDGYGVYATTAPHRLRTLRLVNAADFSSRAAAPGSLISVVGGRVSAANSGSLSFPVLAASEAETQIQVPFETSAANLSLALDTAAGHFTLGLPVQAVSPAIFVSRDGSPMILDGDSGLVLDGRSAAHSGSRLQILATGLGKVRPDWPTGMAAPLENPPVVAATVKAYLDRVPVQVTRAALAPGYIGFYLVEVQLPELVNAGPAELYIAADGQESNRVQLVLEP
ncbi:MAG TPA: hypothetical protein VN924_24755 [Bryobacteraceae bacterium]|nr:hypothetical protein [Bryobacteraceae bacterium]